MRAFIGLGGNLGEPVAAFRSVAAELRGIGPVRASSLYTSKPRDRGKQPAFTNAAVEIETELEPPELLAMLKRLELALGRDPAGKRWGPRIIDLDILAFDGHCFTDPDLDLIVPHPRLQERRFALEPLVELDPRLKPWSGVGCADLRIDVTVVDLLATVAAQEVQRIGGPEWADPPAMRSDV